MLFPIGQGRGVIAVRVAVMAKVRAGVVLTDVFRHDAATGGTLALVLAVIAGLTTVGNAEERIAWNEPRADDATPPTHSNHVRQDLTSMSVKSPFNNLESTAQASANVTPSTYELVLT